MSKVNNKKPYPWYLHEKCITKGVRPKKTIDDTKKDYRVLGISKEELIGLTLRTYNTRTYKDNIKSSCDINDFYIIVNSLLDSLMVLLNNNQIKELDSKVACGATCC